jgi:hypothetical protein
VTEQRRPLPLLRVAIVLALVFNLVALVVLIRPTPIAFTLFMFLAQPLMAVALVLFVVAVVAELRARPVL